MLPGSMGLAGLVERGKQAPAALVQQQPVVPPATWWSLVVQSAFPRRIRREIRVVLLPSTS